MFGIYRMDLTFYVLDFMLTRLIPTGRLLSGLLVVFILTDGTSQALPNWELKKDEDSIRIYVANNPESKIKMIRAEFTLHAKREDLFHQLLRADLYREWQYNTIKSEIVETVSPRELLYYCEVEAPWPVDNRDLIMRIRVNEHTGEKDFSIITSCMPDARPKISGIVRVPASRGEWRVRQVGPEMLKVDFRIQIDPGGYVPAWLVNLTLTQAPFQTFSNLKKRLALMK